MHDRFFIKMMWLPSHEKIIWLTIWTETMVPHRPLTDKGDQESLKTLLIIFQEHEDDDPVGAKYTTMLSGE